MLIEAFVFLHTISITGLCCLAAYNYGKVEGSRQTMNMFNSYKPTEAMGVDVPADPPKKPMGFIH